MAEQEVRKKVGINNILGKPRIYSILRSFHNLAHPDYSFIGIIDYDATHIQTIAMLAGRKTHPNIFISLKDAPYNRINKHRVIIYKKSASKYCPNDLYFKHWNIHGFIGYPIVDSDRHLLGVLAAFYKAPLADPGSILEEMKLQNNQLVVELEREYRKRHLGQKEKRFEDLLRNSREIILIIDKEGKVLYRVPSNTKILGLSDKDAIGVNIRDVIHPDDIGIIQNKLKEVGHRFGRTTDFQVRARNIYGEYKWVEGTATNKINDRAIRGLVINYQDVSDRKAANDELESNERRFRTLIERSHDCISLVSDDNKRLYYSPSVTNILGYTPDELIGTDAHSLTHPDDIEEMQRISMELRRAPNKSVTYQARLKAKSGEWKWIEAIATNLLDDPDVRAIVVNFKDISDHKQTEEKLRVSERSFREFLEAVNLAAIIMNSEGRVEFINDYLLSLIGYSRLEIIGKSFLSRFMNPDDKFIETFNMGIHDGRIPQHFESTISTRTGTTRLIAWNNSIMRRIDGEVSGIACIGEDITEFRKNEKKVQLQVQRVSALHAIDVVISSSFDARIVFSVIVDQIIKQMGVDAVKILSFDPIEKRLTCVADQGFNYSDQKPNDLTLSESHSARAIIERHTVRYPDNEKQAEIDPTIFKQENFAVGYSTPMTIKGQVKGVVEVYSRTRLDPDDGWMEFFETLAGQAAIAIENDEMFERLERALADLTSAYDSTLEGWVRALDLRDKETIGHTQRVAMMVVRFALELGVSGDDLVNIRRGALLHDIGKMGIPDYILNKAGPLTDDERQIIQRHPQYAYDLLQPIHYLRPSLDIPYAHHERWDGKGYPRGLKGEEIPLSARIFSIVDVWDALGSTRTYREKWDNDKMIAYLEEQSGKKFDPSIVKVFIDLYNRKLI